MSARVGRVGVVVLDHGRPLDAERAAASARDPDLTPLVLIVENGPMRDQFLAHRDLGHLSLPRNLGFGGGMNVGIERLSQEGCDRILLLNSDAVLEPGCLRLLAEALDDPAYAAVGPVILSESRGVVESQGLRIDLRWGRVHLAGHGRAPEDRGGTTAADALSGAAIMLSRAAIARVGLLDADYFFGFEDVDWCLRARQVGFALAVVHRARARHAGSATIGRESADRFYYATRNHIRCVERHLPRPGIGRSLRRLAVLALNLALAMRQREAPRRAALRAACEGLFDARHGRFGASRDQAGRDSIA